MGLTDKLRYLRMRLSLAWRAWRAAPAQPSEGLSEVEEPEPDFFGDEETSQREEIAEGLERELLDNYDALIRSIRGGNGHKKA